MKIVVINLATERDRWAAVSRQFARVGLSAHRFDAVVGRDVTEAQRALLYSPHLNARQYHRPLQAGEIGCYASHLLVWQHLVDSKEARIAVFEDDVDIDPGLPETLQAIDCTERPWDIVKLIGRRPESAASRWPLDAGRQLIAYRRVPGLTSAYVIRREAAEKLLARRIPFGRPIDVDLRHWWECDLRVHGVWPYPVYPAPSSLLSTIEGRRRSRAPAVRIRKFVLQARYSMQNWQARQALRLGLRQDARPQRASLADRPAR
jgi:glycosyl transferase, family 25